MAQTIARGSTYFNRTLKAVQRLNAIKSETYPEASYLFDNTGVMLADRVADIKRKFPNVLEIGSSGSIGRITNHLAENCHEQIGEINLTADSFASKWMIEQSLQFYKEDVEFMYPNENRFPVVKSVDLICKGEGVQDKNSNQKFEYDLSIYPSNSFELVLLSHDLHWCNDLETIFNEIMRILKPDGVLLLAMAGGETLAELRTSLYLAGLERAGGVEDRCSPLIKSEDISSLLTSANFNLVTCDIERVQVRYPSAVELMLDLKYMGEQAASTSPKKPLSYDQLLATLAIYHSMYKSDSQTNVTYAGHAQNITNTLDQIDEHYIQSEIEHDPEKVAKRIKSEIDAIPADLVAPTSVVATFDIMNGIAWKPHHSQSVPKERGSTEKGFKLHPDRT